jgi:sulfatase modifying factor 1
MLLQKYLQTSRSLAKLASLGDMRESTANENIVSKLLDLTSDSDSSADQIYIAALAMIAPRNPMVSVQGGTLPRTSELAGAKVADFQIGMYPVTYEEWQGVRNWALKNGYDMSQGTGGGPSHPVVEVNWYDCVKWCNAKSEMEGLKPVYSIKEGIYKKGSISLTGFELGSGYRLLQEAEWEWAARGGLYSKGYNYAGSNNLSAVAWYSDNSKDTSNSYAAVHAVGQKLPNELGLFDMSGNVWEFCWESGRPSIYRRIRGGACCDDESNCRTSYGDGGVMDCLDWKTGFRLARSI